MSMVGMNIEEVRALSNQLNQAGSEIEQLASTLTAKLEGTNWVGADATRFKSEWNSTHQSNLRNVVSALQQAAQAANQNAQDQENVSS